LKRFERFISSTLAWSWANLARRFARSDGQQAAQRFFDRVRLTLTLPVNLLESVEIGQLAGAFTLLAITFEPSLSHAHTGHTLPSSSRAPIAASANNHCEAIFVDKSACTLLFGARGEEHPL
jgi:hypothetical protein